MKKMILVMVLIFCLLTTTQTAYGFFKQDEKIVIGTENEIYKIKQTMGNATNKLIPLGSVLKEGDTYYKTFKYEVYVEDGVNLESEITNIDLENSDYTSEELNLIFNFDMRIDHIKTVQISNGLFSDTTEGELVQITVTISMNNLEIIDNPSTMHGHNLSFSYLLRVSKS